MAFDAAWYIVVYGSSALILLASADWRLTPPILLWFACYAGILCYFVPRLRERSRVVSEMRSTADRARGGQLHQHPDGQAVRPRPRRGRVRARGGRSAHRRIPRPDADDHRLYRAAGGDECRADRRHRGAGDLAVEHRAHQRGRGGDGAAADLADHQHGGLGGAQRDLDLREYRHGAGRHAVDRGGAADARSAGRARAAS